MRRLISLVLMILLLVTATPLMAQDDVEVCSPADISARADAAVQTYVEARDSASNMDVALARLSTLEDALGEIQARCINIASQGMITVGSGTLDDPFAFGETGDTGDGFSLRITGYIRPGNQLVYRQNRFNDRPPTGMEYLIVKAEVACDRDTSGLCEISDWDFDLVGSEGQIYDTASVVYDDDLDLELLPGATGQGDLVYMIKQSEQDLLILYREGFSSREFVAFEASPSTAAGIRVTSTASLNVRGGPGTGHAVMANFPKGETDIAIGRTEDGSWLQISTGWVFTDLIETEGNVMGLPVISQ